MDPEDVKRIEAEKKAALENRRIQRGQYTKQAKKVDEFIQAGDAIQGMCTLNILRIKWQELKDIDKIIIDCIGALGFSYETEFIEYDDYLTDLYCKLSAFEMALTELSIQSNPTAPVAPAGPSIPSNPSGIIPPVNKNKMYLPKLQLPNFTGDILQWQSFWDLFNAAVHTQTNLSNVEKFSHLKCHLTGQAKMAIEGLMLTSDNYIKARTILIDRFGQTQMISEAYMNSLINIKGPSESLDSLRLFYDNIELKIRSLESLGTNSDSYGAMLVPIILSKLPQSTRYNITREHGSGQWNLHELRTSLLKEIRVREACTVDSQYASAVKPSPTQNPPTAEALLVGSVKFCGYCASREHNSSNCKIDLETRFEMIKKDRRCFNCLGRHVSRFCRSTSNCKNCGKRHHTTLCGATFFKRSPGKYNPSVKKSNGNDEQNGSSTESKSVTGIKSGTKASTYLMSENHEASSVLLKTAVASVSGDLNEQVPGRLLFDDGSQRTFCTVQLTERLSLKPIRQENLDLSGFGITGGKSREVDIVQFNVVCDESLVPIQAIVVPVIARPLVVNSNAVNIPEFQGLKLAHPPMYYSDSFDIEILVGSDHYYDFICGTDCVTSASGTVAVRSKLGYIICGPVSSNHVTCLHTSLLSAGAEQMDFQNFWSLETLGIKDSATPESSFLDEYCDSHISKGDGIYLAKLPWKENHDLLQSNYGVAYSRTRSLARRLSKTPHLLDKYDGIIKYQLERDFIEKVDEQEISSYVKCHYIPHHAVFRDSATTPLRVVYDCSCKGSKNSPSLNECLEAGPPLLNDISSILMRFRLFQFALVTDIEKAFLHVGLHPCDRDVTRFFWISDATDSESEMDIYRFKRVLFGATCSPFMLNSTLIYHLRNSGGTYADQLLRDVYVDNVSTSLNSESEVVEFYKEARSLKEDANFNFRCWSSNCQTLESLAQTDGVAEKSRVVKNLGVYWDIDKDVIKFPKRPISNIEPTTKRSILKSASTVFDPVGFLTPVVIKSKILLQDIWKGHYEWDEALPSNICLDWDSISNSINDCLSIEIPRSYFKDSNWLNNDSELHVFCDGSLKAFGSAVYLVSGNESSLVMSKSRVAPVRELTVPKLELMAATIGARLVNHVSQSISMCTKPLKIHAWTDSQIVLGWLKSQKTLPQFVKNRVDEIKSLVKVEQWGYCPTDSNPADLVTRGITSDVFREQSNFWFKGPHWLVNKTQRKFPVSESSAVLHTGITEDSSESIISEEGISVCDVIDVKRFNSFSTLVRTTAYVMRFISILKSRVRDKEPLSGQEIQSAENLWIKKAQFSECKDIVDRLQGKNRKKIAEIDQLQLFLDPLGVIRCRGRLQNAPIDDDSKHPKFVPKTSQISNLITYDAHRAVIHAGSNATIAKIREKFWIPQIRSKVKFIVRHCVICRKVFGRHFRRPSPAPLPYSRVAELPAFYFTGVDYCGPLYLKDSSKCWVCLFTCAITRAVHIEVVTDNSAESFLFCFRRFAARRSVPRKLLSDNSTTFIGANTELKKIFKELRVQQYLSKRNIAWQFITKRAPWQGGFWERIVGLTKTSLKKVLGRSSVTIDELYTILTEIEANLNDRPLMYVTSDIKDDVVLTPSHLMCGRRITALPPCSDVDSDPEFKINDNTLCSRYRYVCNIVSQFWQRWKSEYLTGLREVHRYVGHDDYVKQGAVVLIHDDKTPRLKWHLGIIVELHPSLQDGKVRSCTVKTANGITNRPVCKLYPLEIDCDIEHVSEKPGDSRDSESSKPREKRLAAIAAEKKITQLFNLEDDDFDD